MSFVIRRISVTTWSYIARDNYSDFQNQKVGLIGFANTKSEEQTPQQKYMANKAQNTCPHTDTDCKYSCSLVQVACWYILEPNKLIHSQRQHSPRQIEMN
jgi:hypothetical protein